MLRILCCLAICLATYTSAKADPTMIGGSANVSNFVTVFNWNQLGPHAYFNIQNTSDIPLTAISFNGWETGDEHYPLTLQPGASASFSTMILNVPNNTSGAALFNSMVLHFSRTIPNPEPATIVLFGLGLAALARKLRANSAG